MIERERDAVRSALRKIARLLDANKVRRDDLYTERMAVYEQGRALGMTQRDLADAAGVSEVAVTAQLGKAKRARERTGPST